MTSTLALDRSELFAIGAACLFGLAHVTTQRALREGSIVHGAAMSNCTTALLFWILAPFAVPPLPWHAGALTLFGAVGIFFPCSVTLIVMLANRRMGPSITAALTNTTPLFAALGGMLLFGEALGWLGWTGVLGVTAGIALIAGSGSDANPRTWPAWVLLLPLAAAVIRAFAQVITKGGLTLWPFPLAACVATYSVSALAMLVWARSTAGSFFGERRGARWFMLSGILNGIGVWFMYSALESGPVSVVSAVIAAGPLVTLAASLAFLKSERLGLRAFAGAVLTVAGVIVILRS